MNLCRLEPLSTQGRLLPNNQEETHIGVPKNFKRRQRGIVSAARSDSALSTRTAKSDRGERCNCS